MSLSTKTDSDTFPTIINILARVGYKDDSFNTLALHVLNTAHVINMIHQSAHTPIYQAAFWLDNIALNVMYETHGYHIPCFVYDMNETTLYIVHDLNVCPLLYLRDNGMLDVWRGELGYLNPQDLNLCSAWYLLKDYPG